jgi:hypothetical protein
MRIWKQTAKYVVYGVASLICVVAVGLPLSAQADHAASTNYQVNETFFGSGGELSACSTTYCSKQSAGELTVGNTSSTNYQAQGGFNTDRQPYIEFSTTPTSIDLGTLDTATTATTTAQFTVKAYLSNGYTVVNASDPPSNNGYVMQNLITPTASSAGSEQFGINLVANTVPTTFGANPSYIPDSTFSHGQVAAAYSTPNLYLYNKSDVVALSTMSTSDTTFTISYIFNISHVTPGGSYVMHHVLVATASY